jgi:hypothetical protein
MKGDARITLLCTAYLMGGMGYGSQGATAQEMPNSVVSGFLRSHNAQDFFRQGQAQSEKEIEQWQKFLRLRSQPVLKIDPDAPIQEQDIRGREPMVPKQNRGDR